MSDLNRYDSIIEKLKLTIDLNRQYEQEALQIKSKSKYKNC